MLQYFVGENFMILFLQSMNFLCCTVYDKIFVDYELSKFNGRFNFVKKLQIYSQQKFWIVHVNLQL